MPGPWPPPDIRVKDITALRQIAKAAAQAYGIPVDLFIAMIMQESGFNPDAEGASGEKGIAQFMPETEAGLNEQGHTFDAMDPEQALYAAAFHLADMAGRYGGSMSKAIAAYNAGEPRVNDAIQRWGDNWLQGIPTSTRDTYLPGILGGSRNYDWEARNFREPVAWTEQRIEGGAAAAAVVGEGLEGWPTKEQYPNPDGGTDYPTFHAALGEQVSVWAENNTPLPEGLPLYAHELWKLIRADIEAGEPTALELEAERLENEKLKQDLELGEPFGIEEILRSEGGTRGFNDFWAGRGKADDPDPDYAAGFNFAQASDEPRRREGLTAYLDQIISEIELNMEARGMSAEQALAEFDRQMTALEQGQREFRLIQPYTVRAGDEYIYGFEPGGIATKLGLQPIKTEGNVIPYDPFQQAIDVVNRTPSITDIGVPEVPTGDPDYFARALEELRRLAGLGG